MNSSLVDTQHRFFNGKGMTYSQEYNLYAFPAMFDAAVVPITCLAIYLYG